MLPFSPTDQSLIYGRSESGDWVDKDKDINLMAGGDINMEGTNMNNKASAKFAAEGGSGAELTSGGQAVIKGAMVAIN